MKAPNHKHQNPNKSQSPKDQFPKREYRVLVIGILEFGIVCDLVLDA
jgi:hypothetical protein